MASDGREIHVQLSVGDGRNYPGDPKCKYKRKIFDCLTFVFESKGINGDILVEILFHFDILTYFIVSHKV